MKNLKFATTILVLNAFLFAACDKDDDTPQDEKELITTVMLTFTEVGGGSVVFSVKDLDGDGGNPPVADTIILKPNTDYTIGVEFLDESAVGQSNDLTQEVKAEANEHLICFTATGSMAEPVIGDVDGTGKPLGLESTVTTGNAGTGTLQVSLKHEPDKLATVPCATGETDVEVTFPVKVE